MDVKEDKDKKKIRIPTFSVILIMVTLMIVGIAMIPLLNIQYSPTSRTYTIYVSYSWSNASARLVEQEITSKIEGAVAPIAGVQSTSSRSYYGGGSVQAEFKKEANMDAVRFEISTKLKQVYSSFPEGVSYPHISSTNVGGSQNSVLTYAVKADIPTGQIQEYAEENIRNELIKLEGVDRIEVTGGTPEEWIVTFDPNLCSVLGITPSDITRAISASEEKFPLGFTDQLRVDGSVESILVSLHQSGTTLENWENIGIKSSNNRLIRLADIATLNKQPQKPTHYYRINGLNNVNVTVYAEPLVNTLALIKKVDARIDQIRDKLPEGFSISKENDASVYINKELGKIYWRTGLSVFILLIFVFLASRSFRYLLLIAVTMLANILVAFIFYNLFDLELHIYSLAGITVSLGLIIDTSIIMIDHYGRFNDRKAFLAILGALCTTIGSLTVILVGAKGNNIADFAVVVIINLAVSLVISALFIPALLEKLPIKKKLAKRSKKSRRMRRLAKVSNFYARFIAWSRKRRWAYIVIVVLAFGFPVHMLPAKLGDKSFGQAADSSRWVRLYNKTIGSQFYQDKLKDYIEYSLGGTLRLFAKDFSGSNFRSEPEQTRLNITASLPAGCTIHQLNEVMVDMENFLSQFSEIETFTTNIHSYDNGTIDVTFKPEAEKTGFPYQLQGAVTFKAISLGGASWGVYGIGQAFNNNINTGDKDNWITVQGYNYNQIYKIAQEILDTISQNPRVQNPEIAGERHWGASGSKTEFYLDFNFEKFALYNISPYNYFSALNQKLYHSQLPQIYNKGKMEDMVLVSSESEIFDAWNMANDIIPIESQNIKLSEMGGMNKRLSGNNINKRDQQYTLYIGFKFIGSQPLAEKYTQKQIERIKETLPVGYNINQAGYGGWWWGGDNSKPYWIIALIIILIYSICAVLFESLRQPLVIISMIPISYIGVFLTFYLFKIRFDEGGFASFIMLAGLVVNAGIYIVNSYNILRRRYHVNTKKAGLTIYMRAYNRKIVPITLTVISTILGLLPFVIISREPFWFTLAAGAMGGMLFSFIAVFVYLPIFLPLKYKS